MSLSSAPSTPSTRSTPSSPIEPPTRYRGVFQQATRRYLPMLEEARESLRSLAVPAVVRDHFLSLVTLPQPTFVLFPLMFLHLADATGGVTARHRRYLPFQMLAMEVIGLYDDTVDYTPLRSGTPTYAARRGAPAAAVLSGFVLSTLVERTADAAPEFSGLLTRMFENLCAHGFWEHEARYPDATPEALSAFIRTRCDAIPPVNAYVLDGALLMCGREPLPRIVHERFGDLQQDVDDLVNIVEAREDEGENDDIKLGIASYPLLATIRLEPRARELLDALWRPLRAASLADRGAVPTGALRHGDIDAQHHELVELVKRHGVHTTVEKVLADCEVIERETPESARPAMREFAFSVVDRLRDYDARARIEAHA